MIRDFLLFIKVIQKKEFVSPKGSKHFKYRLNPFNPLTYLTVIITIIIGIICFGVVGFWSELSNRNEFKWH